MNDDKDIAISQYDILFALLILNEWLRADGNTFVLNTIEVKIYQRRSPFESANKTMTRTWLISLIQHNRIPGQG